MRRYPFPISALVDRGGNPTQAGRAYLIEIENRTKAVNAVTNLDDEETYDADELRDKLIELIAALQG